ncbi:MULTISPECIES: alanine/glycine:cation symporter family protein [Fusobacterium]|uniref:alanine/glycine:cation symporter family protein n=1 Tax=Fusobacterium TaxID=848 RepID=UPI0008A1CA49|nr:MULTISPECIES: amino acid carrier protein [Fusobacterium]MCD7979243.1 amino acid carrier protein [Fusobacterium sp.]MCF0171679.1 sodium:alanine symporter family protein [Fusobacterium varium]MCF2672665.1 sodium:alanine symporter family protein [Fusobacterium varium]MCI6031482.1 amino acid carrier protein [Fusobacterium varium]MDY4004722.1 amino acid carrier protein [Fusobacterium varium]
MLAYFEALVSFLWGLPIIVIILGTGFYFTFKTGFFQVFHLKHIFSETICKIIKKGNKAEEGGKGLITPFEAVATAIGGSVGVGNIGGVATAMAVGGPGSLFWLWIAAFVGMILKMAEVSLGVYYREKDEKGDPYGGPTYYMEKGLGEEKGHKWWLIPAAIFGGGIFSTFFITVQNYTVSEAVSAAFGIKIIYASIIYIICNYILIIGGIKSLGKLAGKIVPIMCVFYVGAALYIVAINIGNLPATLGLVFKGAFTGTAAAGGFAGAAFSQVMRIGMARSVFSNEAGWGSSPMIHASAQTDHPIKQGLWGAFEVFVDTIVVCTLTCLVIIITGVWSSGATGATLTLNAFETGMGSASKIFIATGIFLFGVTTSSGWYAYYEIILRHLMKSSPKLKDGILKFYKIFYPVPGFVMVLMATTIGMPGSTVWLFADFTTAVPTFINIAVMLSLSGTFFKLFKDYKTKYILKEEVKPEDKIKLFYEEN